MIRRGCSYTNYSKAESNDLETEDNLVCSRRYVHHVDDGRGIEVFGQAQPSFQKISFPLSPRRWLSVGLKSLKWPRRLFGVGLFREQEELSVAEKGVWRATCMRRLIFR